jgi:hypothetical protein
MSRCVLWLMIATTNVFDVFSMSKRLIFEMVEIKLIFSSEYNVFGIIMQRKSPELKLFFLGTGNWFNYTQPDMSWPNNFWSMVLLYYTMLTIHFEHFESIVIMRRNNCWGFVNNWNCLRLMQSKFVWTNNSHTDKW